MPPKTLPPNTAQLFQYPLQEHINLDHPLVKLTALINWTQIEINCARLFHTNKGRPAIPSRLIAGLLYLQHTFNLSDEEVVFGWVENVYWQYFTGEAYLQTHPPINPSSLTKWRQRLGEAGVEELLKETVQAALRSSALRQNSMKTVIVDTTVMPKAIAYPTDSKLLEAARKHLVKAAKEHKLTLRQNYNRVAPTLVLKIGRYAHARQYKRMQKHLNCLRIRVGRVYRDVQRQLSKVPQQQQALLNTLLGKVKRILEQRRQDKNKLYALHAPEVECIGKGKIRTPYEFGVKVSITTTLREGFVLGACSLPGNPYDGHTLDKALAQASQISQSSIDTAVVDRGYKGAEIDDVRILRSGQKKGMTQRLKGMIKRRSSIEGTIGHMKTDGRLGRNWLKGSEGDAIHAVLCGAGHNLRLLLRYLRHFYVWLLGLVWGCLLDWAESANKIKIA